MTHKQWAKYHRERLDNKECWTEEQITAHHIQQMKLETFRYGKVINKYI